MPKNQWKIKLHDGYKIEIKSLPLWSMNPRAMPEENLEKLKHSIKRYSETIEGWNPKSGLRLVEPVVFNILIPRVTAGHQRLKALLDLGQTWIHKDDIRFISTDEKTDGALNIALNNPALRGLWDIEKLRVDLAEIITLKDERITLVDTGFALEEYNLLLSEGKGGASPPGHHLAEQYLIPPFSILDSRQGYWQERKAQWIALGIKGEEGRGLNLLKFSEVCNEGGFRVREKYKTAEYNRLFPKNIKKALGAYAAIGGAVLDRAGGRLVGSSIFDPVLAELMFLWFCPRGGHILDPFAGEITKGAVAEYLKFHYTGIEIRKEQIEANEALAKKIKVHPRYILGDANDLEKLVGKESFDMIFTSPPYYDLELYSEMDMSALPTYEKFLVKYRDVIRQCYQRARPESFLVFKVGEIRDRKGIYRNFVGDSIRAIIDAGYQYYNELILITPAGSLPIRVPKIFNASRKVGHTHQNIIVGFKGEPDKIRKKYGVMNFDKSCLELGGEKDSG